jgi:hypothetical protein
MRLEAKGSCLILIWRPFYEVETRVLNQAIKRNIKRFPPDFMFQLTKDEFEQLRFQINNSQQGMSSQIVMTSAWNRPLSALPLAFTEGGVAMLSGVLNSDKAINRNISIMRAFIPIRHISYQQMDLRDQLKEIKERKRVMVFCIG